ncbi:MAG: ferredoxin [Acidimicrobiia bacterium]|nr:ferredoxin [Acidimicrobiia bacterium]
MKVWIDQDLCTGDGLCEEIAPDVFVQARRRFPPAPRTPLASPPRNAPASASSSRSRGAPIGRRPSPDAGRRLGGSRP